MFQYIIISYGKIGLGALEFDLYDSDGNLAPETTAYRGDAWVTDQHVSIKIGAGVQEYRIGSPTRTSVDYAEGKALAERQKRRRQPNDEGRTRHYYYGWAAGWEAKRASQAH